MHVTLQDVAKLAGVSTKTVSCVVNEQGGIGFDNMPESAFWGPPLTTVYQQLGDVGRIV